MIESRVMLPVGLLVLVSSVNGIGAETATVDVDSRVELFVDDRVIDTMVGVRRLLHSPDPREVAIVFDRQWEGGATGYVTVFQDGGLFRMYYRAQGMAGSYRDYPNCYGPEVVGYAQSTDGVHWTKPDLNLFSGEYTSRYGKPFTIPEDNNVVWVGRGRLVHSTHNFAPFKDTNPDCKPEARYKAFGRVFEPDDGLLALQSPDAVHWSLMQEDPVIVRKGRNDTHPAVFWDSVRKRYVEYHRGNMRGGIRDLITSTSGDFIRWTEPVDLTYGGTPVERLYSPKVVPYFRAPHIFLAFPMRLVTGRPWVKEHPEKEVSDGVLMSSRDGVSFDRSFMEGWIRPGLDPERKSWIHGNTEPAWGLLQTGPAELSVYWIEHFGQLDSVAQLRRGTLRVDGFVSVHADYAGGEFVTKPLSFSGRRLAINFSTSAVGSVRVEVQDAGRKPIAGFTLAESPLIYGDSVDRIVRWRGGGDVGKLLGQPVRLRFVMKDADLYSIQFRR